MGMRGVMFDAGGVLFGPIGGRWNPRFDFERIVARHYPGVGSFAAAIAVGQRFLDKSSTTPPRGEYHRVMLDVLGVEPSASLLAELDAPLAEPVVEVYPDVRPALERLRLGGVRMSVVSDSWAGLVTLLESLDLAGYFDGFAISEVLGCNKPDPRMYAEGQRLLGLPADECLFIDDDPLLVQAARELGHQGLTLDRGASLSSEGVIASLDALAVP
ncbi:HAD family hydrolase [Dactylosporangium sp. NPDC051541]|uniref:HAD family hydrolase n=1 Tax=Dactylosporangium sp. NPDC051541 TaxID=3363977 RepID=UPI0037B12F3F